MALSEIIVTSNPRRRHRRRPMTAKQLKYFGKRRHRRTIRARRNPVARRRRAAAAPVRRRRYSRRSAIAAVIGRRRRSRSGLMGSASSFLSNDIVPAAIGAGGALALDMVWPHLTFLPPQLQSGPLTPVVRIAGAVGLGVVAGMVAGSRIGRNVAMGALTVTAYDIIKGYMAASMPAPVPTPAQSSLPPSAGVSGYAPRLAGYAPSDGLGWINPARNAGAMSGYAPA